MVSRNAYVLGAMDIECPHCHALKWPGEQPGLCCNNGKVSLVPLEMPPELVELCATPHFQRHSRAYSAAFAISSIGGVRQDRSVNNANTQTYRVSGLPYHRICPANPRDGHTRRNAAIYFTSGAHQDVLRAELFGTTRGNIHRKLREILEKYNPLVQTFKNVGSLVTRQFKLVFHHFNDHVYNPPVAEECGAIVPVDALQSPLDVALSGRAEDSIQYVSTLSGFYDSIQYLLIHARGEQGWHVNLPHTCREHYAFHAFSRPSNLRNNPLSHLGAIAQQYWVDMFLKIEKHRLDYFKNNQDQFRLTNLNDLRRAQTADMDDLVGIKLPSSHTGCPRNYHEVFLDSMKAVKEVGGPHLFLTVSCNPKWPEIQAQLRPGENPFHRPELLVRAFKLRLAAIEKDIDSGNVFGMVVMSIRVIEFQARMLPHAHLVISLSPTNPLATFDPAEVDRHITGEIPDPNTEPELYSKVTKYMLHHPCHLVGGMACTNDTGSCRDQYPKDFAQETYMDEDGWVHYRRRSPADGGFTCRKRFGRRGTFHCFTNESVIPTNPYLLLKYDCHIYVSFVNHLAPMKYLFKYFLKGATMAAASLHNSVTDEIEAYITGRFVSCCESVWRILGFPLIRRTVPVLRLGVHLPGNPRGVIHEQALLQRMRINQDTKLTKFFEFCRQHPHVSIRYEEMPKIAVWKPVPGALNTQGFRVYEWKRRRRRTKQLGRIQRVPVALGETFYLRLLLKNVVSPHGFEDLLSFNGVTHESFQDAATARGLLGNTERIQTILDDTWYMSSSVQVCETFASLLLNALVPNPSTMFFNNLCTKLTDDLPPTTEHSVRVGAAAFRINQVLIAHGTDIGLYIDGVHPVAYVQSDTESVSVTAEQGDTMYRETIIDRTRLDPSQAKVYDAFFIAIERNRVICRGNRRPPRHRRRGQYIFLDAPGGYGKTRVNNSILGTCMDGNLRCGRSIRPVRVAAVATTNQAAQLLIKGSTAHSTFRIPLNLQPGSNCSIPIDSDHARELRRLEALVFDEAPSAHRYIHEAIDRALRDIKHSNLPYGGLVILYSGDFRQTLPIVLGSRANGIDSSIKCSMLWENFRHMRLRINHRATSRAFQKFLLRIGNGSVQQSKFKTGLGRHIKITKKLEKVVQTVYSDVIDTTRRSNMNDADLCRYYSQRLILAPKHVAVDSTNIRIFNSMPGDEIEYVARNRLCEFSRRVPLGALAEINPGNMGPQILRIKMGMPVILIRTLNKHVGLVTGARGLIVASTPNVIRIRLLAGPNAATVHSIYRLWHENDPSLTNTSGIRFERDQFPVKPAFACTIDRSQGMTLEYLGLLLRDHEVFSHGQLYTALSRVRSPENIIVTTASSSRRRITTNVVYREVLQ